MATGRERHAVAQVATGASCTSATGRERHAVAQVATGASCTSATGREQHAVAQVATGASCTSARPISCGRRAWPLHPLTNSSSGYCHRMAGAVQVFAVTADWRVSRPWVRQSTAQSHHQLLPACGARGACKWRTRAGRWCSGCGLRSSGAQGPRHRDADTSKWRRAESDMQSLR